MTVLEQLKQLQEEVEQFREQVNTFKFCDVPPPPQHLSAETRLQSKSQIVTKPNIESSSSSSGSLAYLTPIIDDLQPNERIQMSSDGELEKGSAKDQAETITFVDQEDKLLQIVARDLEVADLE